MFKNYKISRNNVIIFLVGVSLGLIIMNILTPKKAVQLNDDNIIFTINDKQLDAKLYYEYLKKQNGIEVLRNIIDNIILEPMYKENEKIIQYINKKADDDIKYYISYTSKTEKDFYESVNVKNRDEYLEKLKLDYRRSLYYEKYLKSLIKDEEINNYYDNKVFGDIKTKYIAISKDNSNGEEILNEIIEKLNNGYIYDDIILEYKDIITYNDLGYISYNMENYETYLNTLLAMEDNTYTSNYVETFYGNTIIFREDQKEKTSLTDAKNDIINILIKEIDKNDPKLFERTLIELRKSNNIQFNDETIESVYNKYCLQFY